MKNSSKTVALIIILVFIVGAVAILRSGLYKGIRPALVSDSETQRSIDDLQKKLADNLSLGSRQPEAEPHQEGSFLIHGSFDLELFSRDVVNPRVIIFDQDKNVLVSEPSEGRVSRYDQNGKRQTVVSNLNRPHGLAIKDENLLIAETGQVIQYDYDNGQANNPRVILDLPTGGRHWTRTLGVGPDGNLYISIGSSCNICIEDDWRRDKILQYNFETQQLNTYASGLRNAVFFAWHPETDAMWATEMGRDWLGDDLPPDEVNIIKEGGDYGFPYCYGKNIVDPEFSNPPNCEDKIPAFIDLFAHEAPLGIDFFKGQPVIAMHGSWNRAEPIGYEVVRYTGDEYQTRETLVSGWLQPDGNSIGRPAGILADTESGHIYITDDSANVIYRLVER